jgi:hypothetical protein
MRTRTFLIITAAVLAGTASAAAQQQPARVSLDLRGGGNVPTFDITAAARTGPSFGAGISVPVGPRLSLMADADFGFHPGVAPAAGVSGPDVDVYHFVGKLGYQITPSESPWAVVLNAGAGAMTFAIDGGPTKTYPAINVGAKITYRLARNVSFLLSPQGDIAFSKTADLGTTNSWVWPFTVGLRLDL